MTTAAGPFAMPDPQAMTERLKALGRRLAARRGGAAIEIATTPKDEIWRDGKIRLYRYHPVAEGIPSLGPMLILPWLVGRQSATDR